MKFCWEGQDLEQRNKRLKRKKVKRKRNKENNNSQRILSLI